jgi:hypothetical protein
MVKVVIIVLLGTALCAVMTWIAPNCLKGKAIVPRIDLGEGLAMRLGPTIPEALADSRTIAWLLAVVIGEFEQLENRYLQPTGDLLQLLER